ncbi:hypothetical protein ERJ75_000933700 [Trypanosoma vivax]|nr:hypothetical protein TRVL_00673 [Trypanosoma vivax]KAH8611172.1 hypothetical protein ERJ75_000933700 [Trypanosoma vivax]
MITLKHLVFFPSLLGSSVAVRSFHSKSCSSCGQISGSSHSDKDTECKSVGGISGETPTVALNAPSTTLRRFLQQYKSSKGWWASPSHVDALITLLLEQRESGPLHPLIAAEVVRRLGRPVGEAGRGWVVRCSHSASSVARVAEYLLVPLLPLVGTHTVIRPLLPLIVEWLLCIVDMPSNVALSCVALYVTYMHSDSSRHKAQYESPSPEFLLRHFATRCFFFEDADLRAQGCAVLCDILKCIADREEGGAGQENALLCGSPDFSEAVTGSLASCLFWHGETPLVAHSHVRRAYKNVCPPSDHSRCTSQQEDVHLPVLTLTVEDDDVFRRLLLRLLAVSGDASLDSARSSDLDSVQVDLALNLKDPSLVLRFIRPLLDFVTHLVENDVRTPLVLSFKSIQTVICVAVSELQKLKQDSDDHCGYVLLPHKPRIHALKSLVEKLLNNVQQQQRAERSMQDSIKIVTTFPGKPLQQQLRVLQSFHSAARHLVRTVMKEKTSSVLEEGREGSAVRAGGAVDLTDDLTSLLRNTAFRVLETSLLRYYEALDEWTRCPSNRGVAAVSHDPGDRVEEAISQIEHHAGGQALFFTAQHLIQSPLRQNVTAVVEGLRLVAIQALVLDSPRCEDWLLKGGLATTLADAFFSVWHRLTLRADDIGAHERICTEKSYPAIGESSNGLCNRLLLTMLLLHQRYCSCCANGGSMYAVIAPLAFECSLLRSLVDLLVPDSASTEFSLFAWPSPLSDFDCSLPSSNSSGVTQKLWTQSIAYPHSLSVVDAKMARWDLLDELASLSEHCTRGTRWLWLDSPRSVRLAACDEINKSMHATNNYAGYLLPWSTVAASRHPLRFYDESGQSSLKASEFDSAVESLVLKKGKSVFRLVSIAEEASLFGSIDCTTELSLGHSVTVINPGAVPKRGRAKDVSGAGGNPTCCGNEEYDFLD